MAANEISNNFNSVDEPSTNETSSTATESDAVAESPHNIDKNSALEQKLSNVIEKRTKRSKIANNNTWKRQENKIKRMNGEDYLSVKFDASEKIYKTVAKKMLEKLALPAIVRCRKHPRNYFAMSLLKRTEKNVLE